MGVSQLPKFPNILKHVLLTRAILNIYINAPYSSAHWEAEKFFYARDILNLELSYSDVRAPNVTDSGNQSHTDLGFYIIN